MRIKILLARQISAWRIRQESRDGDSRLWTSMTLAAVSAVIALMIVSLVPRYAAKSLPSKMLNTNSTVSANSSSPASAPSAPVSGSSIPALVVVQPGIVNASHQQAVNTGKPKADVAPKARSQAVSSSAASAPKPRRHLNDDYVAPDTYKYYGTGSNGTGSNRNGSDEKANGKASR